MTEQILPQNCASMADVRAGIDQLDRTLVELLALRAGFIDRATELKQVNGWPARIPDRVEDVVAKVKAAAVAADWDDDLAEELWRRLIDWSIAREARVIRENGDVDAS
ncbi:chorismate mutase [Cognatishimia sp.]|uniref:chorismate mutase n=1 Tax=Cognatishimia sp. TaxID=2211648 RepID=UPI0035150E5E